MSDRMVKHGSVLQIEQSWIPKNTKTASATTAAEELRIDTEIPDDIVFSDDYVYTTVRAISARVNMNMDGFMKEELLGYTPSDLGISVPSKDMNPHNDKYGYRTFRDKNNHVDHFNQPEVDHGNDYLNAKHSPRGKILHAWYEENPLEEDVKIGGLPDPIAKLAGNDVWVKLLMANDRNRFPVLCRAIEDGIVTKVSMGAEVLGSSCSVCGSFAGAPWQYCDHIRYGRGMPFSSDASSYFVKKGVLRERDPVVAFENNHGLQFFEESWILDVQADPTAVIMDLIRGEPGTALRSIGASKTAGQKDYAKILLDLINNEANIEDIEKVAVILNKQSANPNVNITIDNIDELIDQKRQESSGKNEEEDSVDADHPKEMDYNVPPHQQDGEFYPNYPFPCSARSEASDANPEYPMDVTIDVEVCQGCQYNKSKNIGAVDCHFPEVVQEGGSDPLPAGFEPPDKQNSERDWSSGVRDEQGKEIKEFPGIVHPPVYNFDDNKAAKLGAFYKLQNMLSVSPGRWGKKGEDLIGDSLGRPNYPDNRDDSQTDTFNHSVGIGIPSQQVDGTPVDPEGRQWVIDSVKKFMASEFGGVKVREYEGGWINRREELGLGDQGKYDKDQMTLIESYTDDIERGEDVIRDLAASIEDAFNQYAIEFFIDGKPHFTRDVH